jgi:uncharacterized membrane protein
METLHHNPTLAVYGIILCLTGLFIRYIIGKRRFNRRGIGGLQHYGNYTTAILTTIIEWVFSIIGFALILFGFCLIGLGWLENHSSQRQQQPTVQQKSTINKKAK